MPLIIDADRVPKRWAEKHAQPSRSDRIFRDANAIRVAFINNMPDPALEDTELQFFDLLHAASGETPVSVTLFSLPGIERTGQAHEHVSASYSPITDLWRTRFDAAIITGTEPRQSNLRNEPYWTVLSGVFDWAAQNTSSTILSCLAAHAAVLHIDGIGRHRMAEKCAGVFDVQVASDHPLFEGMPGAYRIPHSRWNELREDELTAKGYTILTRSSDAGVDAFVKKTRNSVFLHFQGHPEYGAHTLLKEYRRDVKRFLRGERDDYPTMPRGYFNEAARHPLLAFQETAQQNRREELLETFPQEAVEAALERTWDLPSRLIYMNWLKYVSARKAERQRFAPISRVRGAALGQPHRKRSAAS
ncbi:MAG TPA: homoserine O-succinyltransferase [Candidatus Acidoferrum sp.]|nr:homoserine O-succinyltransferase [Candidatus Acidoferrum sp.]